MNGPIDFLGVLDSFSSAFSSSLSYLINEMSLWLVDYPILLKVPSDSMIPG